jgi:UDP-N-acetyl-2-amino-2-deoxyglucuronate dehydrogenase
MPNFAIVGCGMIAGFHLKALAEIPGTRVVAVVDSVPAALERFAKANDLRCELYTSLAPALERRDVDIVIVSTPSGAHMESAVAAAQAGKHVVVEKPLEVTLERCDRIIEACDQNQVQLCTIFPSRFADANRVLKQAVDAGRFGRLTLGETTCKWWRPQSYYDQGGWRGTKALDGGGALMNQAIHNVDLLQWFMGDVVEVCGLTATLAHERIEVEDVGTAVVRFRNGALGTLEASTSVYPGLLKKTEIHGTEGSVIVEQDDILLWEFQRPLPEDEEIRRTFARKSANTGGAADPAAISFVPHQKQFEDFLAAIEGQKAPAVDGAAARKSVEIILAIYESSWTGRRVTLPLKQDPQRPA